MWRFLRSNSSPCQTLGKFRFRLVDDCPNASVLDHSNADVVALGAHCSLETGSDAVNSKAMLMLTLVFLHCALPLCGSPTHDVDQRGPILERHPHFTRYS